MSPLEKRADLPHILVIDDDERIRQLASRYLQENGFIACVAADAVQAWDLLELLEFDALVVDIMMPGQGGLDFTRVLRQTNDIPVLLLTALGEATDRIAGLECGADDYLAKPFEPKELVLRLKAILRRRPKAKIEVENSTFKVGRWCYNSVYKELQDGADIVRVTAAEDNLLRALASRAGEVISREELAQICGFDSGERTIDVQVTRLRRKIEDDPKMPRCLQTIRGKGYLLRIERV